ncbi:MAG: glycosyltransferase family 9 protein [Pseudomonadota bacterium]|nr:glycosyltransferase family 9 protein [Pseudomonadota bacterium]
MRQGRISVMRAAAGGPAGGGGRPGPGAAARGASLRARAVEAHRAGRLDEAFPLYRAHLALAPNDAHAWTNLGALLRRQGRHEAAALCQRRAHALAPDDLAILGNLGNALHDADALDEALEARLKLVALRPDQAEGHAMLAATLRSLGRGREAAAAAEAGLGRFPGDGELRVQRALSLLSVHDWAAGFEAFSARWETGEIIRAACPVPEWRGEDPAGRRILVLPEQGFGDALLMTRFLPLLAARGAEVLLAAKPPLMRLFEGLDGVSRLMTTGEAWPDADLSAHMMDLPRWLGLPAEGPPPSPPLNIPDDARARAARRVKPFAGRLRVGVCWSGSVTYRANFKRSFGPERFLPLAGVPEVQLFSLYKGPLLEAFRADAASALIVDAAGDDRDFADAAATILEMDLVITMDTAVAHLAGALGKPVWNLLAFSPFWLYGPEGARTDWHPSMRLIRQRRPGDWDGVFAEVADRLGREAARWREARG